MPGAVPQQTENSRVTYQLENRGGNILCLTPSGLDKTQSIGFEVENISDENALVEFTMLAENGLVSVDESEFKTSVATQITVPSNTADNPTVLHIHILPDENASDVTLKLFGIALDPSDMRLIDVNGRPTVTFHHDSQTDAYCPEN
jgi:hypothetical protein